MRVRRSPPPPPPPKQNVEASLFNLDDLTGEKKKVRFWQKAEETQKKDTKKTKERHTKRAENEHQEMRRRRAER
jgi:hypothetical protein